MLRAVPATCSPPRASARGPGEVLVADSTTVNLYKLATRRSISPTGPS